ncbi:K(+)-transporting ATPase subunit C [Synechococcus elongatus IITB7]|uniref:K(+)-transporting ATPase subunit C n=1 Tax=Synechococcus elongatus TaxID=32046 RepID=UPI0030CCCCAE
MSRDFIISIRTTVTLWLLTAFLYPLLIFLIGQGLFPFQANGSLITNDQGQVIGSELIGQSFSSDRYFWGRPSAINYSEGEAASPTGISGASNLAPGNPQLLERIEAEAKRLRSAGVEPVADLLYSSGSGLDPHISIAAAEAQIDRVAKVRGVSATQLRSLIAQATDHRFLGIFGEPGVNVLRLNLALDRVTQQNEL